MNKNIINNKDLKIDLNQAVFCDAFYLEKKVFNSRSFGTIFIFCVANFQNFLNNPSSKTHIFNIKKIKKQIDYEEDTIRKCLDILISEKMIGKKIGPRRRNKYIIYDKIIDEGLIKIAKERWLNGQ